MNKDKYRVFISYSHTDQAMADKIAVYLKNKRLFLLWDAILQPGEEFNERIRFYITHAHVFIPLLTEESVKSQWVNQEIGYAKALNIPVLPISSGVLPISRNLLPFGMIQEKQTLVTGEDLAGIEELLNEKLINALVDKCTPDMCKYVCAEHIDERVRMLASMANEVQGMGIKAYIRQKSRLSSFQAPDREITDPVWKDYYDGTGDVNPYHCQNILDERRALAVHAKSAGCKLIISPNSVSARYSWLARKTRLELFIDFLNGIQDDKIDIAIADDMNIHQNVTITGDWFSAESYYNTQARGFRQTIFTAYAPGIRKKIAVFDNEFNGCPKYSKKTAIDEIDRIIRHDYC